MLARFGPLLLASVLLLAAPLVAIEGWAQVAYRSHDSAGVNSTAGLSITHINSGTASTTSAAFSCAQTSTPGTPAGLVNDLLIALVVSKDSGATTLQASAGWNTLFSDNNPTGVSYQARIYWRIANGSASDNLTVSRANTAAAGCDVLIGRMARFRGVDTANPFQSGSPVPAANWTYSNSNTVTTGTENTSTPTVTPNAMLLFAVLIGDDDGTGIPAGFSESFDSATSNGTDAAISLKYGLGAPAIAYGPFAIGKSGNDPNHGVLIALRPAAAMIEGLTINRPTSPAALVNGDVMVASVAVRPSTISITAPTGWTQVRNMMQNTANSSRMATYVRAVTDVTTEPASYQFVLSGGASAGAAGGIIAFSGVDTAALPPLGTGCPGAPCEERGNTTPSALTHTASAITTTVANSMLVGSFEFTSTPTAGNWASNMTNDRVDQGSPPVVPNNDGLRLLMAHQTQVAIGSSGTRTATGSGVTPDTGLAFLLALRPAQLNHFSIAHSGTGVACDDQTIAITVHNAAHAAVSANGVTVALSTTNGKGTWTGIVAGGGTLSGVSPGNGTASYTFAAASSSVQLSFRYANLTTSSETFGFNVVGGGISETGGTATAADDPSFTMAQAGFEFRNVTDGGTTIPTQIAGKPSNVGFNMKTIRLRAVRTDNSTGACVGLFASQARTVEMGAECNDPASCAGQVVTVNATNVATTANNGAAGAAAYTGVSLTFNASSEADTVITYPDAGQISLHARYDLDPAVAGFEMTGSSNAFVVRPFAFYLNGPGIPGVSGPSGTPFKKAGESFNVTVAAVVWQASDDGDTNGVADSGADLSNNAATPNFGQETTPATVTVTRTLLAPAGGTPGDITGGAFSGFTSGAKTNAMTWSEVGSITLSAALTSGSYLGSGVDVTGSVSPVGRFIPDHFLLTPGTFANRPQSACASTFTYQGEVFRANFMLTARNGLGTPTATTNYTTASGFAKLDATVPAKFAFGAVDLADVTPPTGATALTSRLTLGSSTGTWTAGMVDVNADLSISRTNPDGPFESFRLGALPADDDLVTLRTADLNLDTSVPADTNDRVLVGSTSIRFGQLAMGSRNGSQLRPLRVPVETRSWNGTSFLTNVADSCTTLAADNIALGNYQTNLNACETSVTVGAFAQGRSVIGLSAPGPGNNGSLDLTANLSAVNTGSTCIAGAATPVLGANRLYLQGRWTGATHTQNPVSRATFGTFPGADEVIFSRENF